MNHSEKHLAEQLTTLKLVAVQEHYLSLANEAAQQQWTHVDFLARLIELEATRRQELTVQRRIATARFPAIKTLDQFDWSWPKKINRTQIQNLFRLAFLPDKTNVIFLGGVGSANRTWLARWAMPPARPATRCSSPPPWTSSTP